MNNKERIEELIIWLINRQIKRSRLSKRQYAIGKGIDPANLSKILNRKKSPLKSWVKKLL